VVLGRGSQCRVAARLLREVARAYPVDVRHRDDIRTCGLACEDFAQLPARARPASTSRRRRKPPNYRLRLLLHCGVTWQTSQTARRLLSSSPRSHLSPGYRSQPVAQVPELDNVIAQPVELRDDADR
jgi:hypothetical protein